MAGQAGQPPDWLILVFGMPESLGGSTQHLEELRLGIGIFLLKTMFPEKTTELEINA